MKDCKHSQYELASFAHCACLQCGAIGVLIPLWPDKINVTMTVESGMAVGNFALQEWAYYHDDDKENLQPGRCGWVQTTLTVGVLRRCALESSHAGPHKYD